MTANPPDPGLRFQLLDEPLIRWRRHPDGALQRSSLPELFAALVCDEVRDFPALRAHQRHPWHAFLCQLAAIALNAAERDTPFESADEWRAALLALTPEHPDGAAWCLVSPPDRPALLQAPVPGGSLSGWQEPMRTPDSLDMLLTAKNHQLKIERAFHSEPDDWLFALLSLQTQDMHSVKYVGGISRKGGSIGARVGVGTETSVGGFSANWRAHTAILLATREDVRETHAFADDGIALLWLSPWDGTSALSLPSLAPHYIEICRRVRLMAHEGAVQATKTPNAKPRISQSDATGLTGDPWAPLFVGRKTGAYAPLSVGAAGFNHKVVARLLSLDGCKASAAQAVRGMKAVDQPELVARSIGTKGGIKSETLGFHERRVPLSPRVFSLLQSDNHSALGAVAKDRELALGEVRSLLRYALIVLLRNGRDDSKASKPRKNDPVEDKADRFLMTFEREEDARFFTDLTDEIEADHAPTVRLRWLIGMTERAEAHLLLSFDAGPRSAMRRYRARSAALSRFRGDLRGAESRLPALAEHYRQQNQTTTEEAA